MASFDIKSLFTNVPLNETVEICINESFTNTEIVNGFNRTQFKNFLKLAVNDCIFLFDGKTYKQCDGVAMGNPLGPTMANAFLCYHEKIWLRDCPTDFKPIFYRRYVDDTFVIFRLKEHIPLFLDYINSKHNNIKFTVEIEQEQKIPFLDIEISKTAGRFRT